MPDYQVSGAGSTDYNGLYVDQNSPYNGYPTYLYAGAGGNRWLWCEGSQWILSPTVGDMWDYWGYVNWENYPPTTPDSGTWMEQNGSYPAPTVTALSGHSVSGTITQADSTPVKNVKVTASAVGQENVSAYTDDYGDYTLEGLADDTWTVTPAKLACTFSPSSREVQISGAEVTDQDFTATLTGHGVSGVVADASTGVAGATVSATDGVNVVEAETDEYGAYTLENLPDDEWTLTVEAAGRNVFWASRTITVSGAELEQVDFVAIVPRGYFVSDAGDSAFDGIYQAVGTHNDKPYYKYSNKYLYYSASLLAWRLAMSNTGVFSDDYSAYYNDDPDAPDEGTWYNAVNWNGWPPPPSVTPGGSECAVTGTILDDEENPLPGVLVTATASGQSNATAYTAPDGKYALGGLVPGTWTLTPTKADWSFTPASRQVEISETDPTGQDFTGSTSSPVIEEWAEAACTAESTAQGTGWRVIPGGGEAGPATAGLLTTGWRLRAGASGAAALAAVEGSLRRDRWSASSATATPEAGGSGQRLRLAGAALAAQAEVTARATATLFARAVAECWAVVEALGGQLTYGSGTVQGVTEVEATGERGREGSAQAETQSSATGTGMRLRFAQAGGNMQAAATGTGQAAFSAQAALALHAVVSVAAAALHGVRAVTASMIMWASGRLAPSRLTASGRLAPCRWLAREIGGNGMDYLGTKEKMPEEIVPRRWSVDFGPNLVPGETITGASLRVRDRETLEDVTATMVHGGPVVEDSRVSAIFAGGATGHEYAVTVEVHTSAGAVNQEVFLIAVRTPPGV